MEAYPFFCILAWHSVHSMYRYYPYRPGDGSYRM